MLGVDCFTENINRSLRGNQGNYKMTQQQKEQADTLETKSLFFITAICVLYLFVSASLDFLTHMPIPFILFFYGTMLLFITLLYLLLTFKKISSENSGNLLFIALFAVAAFILLATHYAAFEFGIRERTSPEAQVLRSFPLLIIVIVIIAWFYTKKHILMFCFSIAVIQLIQNALFHGLDRFALVHFTAVTIGQTFIFLVLGLLLERMVQSNRQQQNELERINSRLIQQSNTQRQLAISQERNRMARELHDTLAHTLSGLTVQLETVKAYWDVDLATANRMLEESLQTTRNGLQETRRSLKSLRAGPLEDLGLILALKDLVDSASKQANIESRVEFPENPPSLNAEYDQCIFRISQEAITNILRHANATLIELTLSVDQRQIDLKINDNGDGFQYSDPEKTDHFGISGMKERAELIDGHLEIKSTPGEGTTIHLTKQLTET